MPENCANHETHNKLLERIDIRLDTLEKRVYDVESKHNVSEEKFKQVFEKLDSIIKILETNQSRLPNLVWAVMGSVAGGVFVWLILQTIQK